MALFRRRRDEQRTLTVPDSLIGPGAAGAVTPTNALSIADAYACVRVLADSAASVPLIAYRRVSDGRQRIEGGPAVELLRRPSPGNTQANLIGTVMASLQCHGNAYIGKVRQGGEIVQLVTLDPARVVPEIRGGSLLYAYTPPGGHRQMLTDADVIHVKGLSTDGLVGLSPIKQARRVLSLNDQLVRHGLATMENDGTPRGIVKLQRFGGAEDQVEELREAWNAEHAGTSNAGKTAVVAGEVDYTAISLPMDDLQYVEQRQLSAVEVCRCFRVPPWMVGADTGSSLTYSNVESQALAFVTYSLRPWLVLIEQAISNDRDLFADGEYAEHLVDALLRADSKTRAETYSRALDPVAGWMSRDEVRQRENLPPEPATSNGSGPASVAEQALAMLQREGTA